ncbi:hypothetical protein EMGBS15_17220 [Filimonas sp.]|jgi:hypothetical protein|nr:hypothetical protein EMGBS15_17220 [Filimonas sp.]
MKHSVITIENKKFILLPNEEYLSLKQDIEDLKKVFQRKDESGKEATSFFTALKKANEINRLSCKSSITNSIILTSYQ